MKTVFKKELRDCLRWTPLGMVLGLIMLWMIRPGDVSSATYMESGLVSQLGLCAALIAIALGLLQSLFDIHNDSRGYLLHRPIERQKIFWGKVAAGYVAYMITLAVPVLVAMVYLQFKGIERLPTNAWQVVPFLIYSCVVFLLHPTVLWIANRDARWVGTRLLPSVGAISLAMFLSTIFGQLPFGLLGSVALLLVFSVLFASFTLLASRHAFVHQAQLPPRASVFWRSIAGMVGLVFSGVVLYGMVLGFLGNSIPRAKQDSITYRISMNDQGEWQQIASRRSAGNYRMQETLARDISGEGEFKKVGEDWKQVHGSHLIDFSNWMGNPFNQFNYLGSSKSKRFTFGRVSLVDHRERVLMYDASNRLVSIMTPDGSFESMGDANGAFDGQIALPMLHQSEVATFSVSTNPLLFDDSGIYQLDADELRVNELLDGTADRAMLLLAAKIDPPRFGRWLIVRSLGTRLNRWFSEQEMPQAGSPDIEKTQQFPLPLIKVVGSQAYQVEPAGDNETLSVLRTSDGGYAIVRKDFLTSQSTYSMLTSSGSIEQLGKVKLPETQGAQSVNWVPWTFPPALISLYVVCMAMYIGAASLGSLVGMGISVIGHSLLAAIAIWWLGGRLDLSPRERKIWTIVGGALGFGVLIGLRAIYDKLVREDCSQCKKASRVDLESCEYCDHAWDPPPAEGVEIFEQETSTELAAAH